MQNHDVYLVCVVGIRLDIVVGLCSELLMRLSYYIHRDNRYNLLTLDTTVFGKSGRFGKSSKSTSKVFEPGGPLNYELSLPEPEPLTLCFVLLLFLRLLRIIVTTNELHVKQMLFESVD